MILFSTPVRNIQAGTIQVPATNVPDGTRRLMISIERSNWPETETTLADFAVELSTDGGATWRSALRMLVNGMPDFDENDQPDTSPIKGLVGWGAGSTGVQVRGTVTIAQNLRMGTTVEVF